MSSSQSSAPSGGITFVGALGLLFIGLRLGHVMHWPWLWVTVALWGGLALFIVGAIVVVLIALVEAGVKRGRR